jgi:hypothetical protein
VKPPDEFTRLMLGPPLSRWTLFLLTPVFVVLYALAIAICGSAFLAFVALIALAIGVRVIMWAVHLAWLLLVVVYAFGRLCWLLLRAR